jgi:hypothetical protein
LRLPTKDNCPECYNQGRECRQSQTNRRSVHEKIRYNPIDRRAKNYDIHSSKDVIEHKDEEYVWQENQLSLEVLQEVKREGYNA